MKRFSWILFCTGLLALCAYPSQAQDYPLWLKDPGSDWNEYPTSISSEPNVTATVGFFQSDFRIFDLGYNSYHGVPCVVCNNYENIFVKWREEGNGNTWTAHIFVDGIFNNQVDVQSVPQVDVSQNGDVYVSFTYRDIALVKDLSGNTISFSNPNTNSSYDWAVVKFDASGHYQWHITEGSKSNDFATDVYYNDQTNLLAIAGYVEGSPLNSPLLFAGGAGHVHPMTSNSWGGSKFGNAFAALYEDNGGNANFVWVRDVKTPTFSTDIVADDQRNVYLSGFVEKTNQLAGQTISGNYIDKTIVYQHFIVAWDKGANAQWAEMYGTKHNELDIARGLRQSSLAIIPMTSDLFFAFDNTGSNTSMFPHFGTYVNHIDFNNGSIINAVEVGNPIGANGSSYQGSTEGSPVYNPNIAVDRDGQVYISGNFLLTSPNLNGSNIGIAFDKMKIGGTLLSYNMTAAANNGGHSQVVGWYTSRIDFSTTAVVFGNLNGSYIPNNSNSPYNQLPVYGTSQSAQHDYQFYSALGFKNGRIVLDLNANHGVVNNYNNNGGAQFDGLLVRTFIGNGLYSKPNTTSTQNSTYGTVTSTRKLDQSNTWTLWPNPAKTGQVLTWKSEGQGVVDQIRLVDLTGRVLREWNQPQAMAQGFELPLGELVPGTYLLEATGEQVKQSALVVVQ